MKSTGKKPNIEFILKSPDYSQALKEIRKKWKETNETYLIKKGEINNQINNGYNIEEEKEEDLNKNEAGVAKKKKRKNSLGEKPKRKPKKKKTE